MAYPPGILALPTSLVLLLHLHIMSYPRCSSPEYTPDLFAPRQPLRARASSMEDIVAFLIEKIEGREKFKLILGSVYPCLQPSDSVSFRASAARYIETLRTSAIRPVPAKYTSNAPASSVNKAASTSSKTSNSQSSRTKLSAPPEHEPRPVAWWWSTIVARKSLLEECTGERFEKMLLALSTHSLSVQIPRSSPLHPSAPIFPTLSNILQGQSQEYASLLAYAFDLHAQRLQKVALLNARTQDLLTLRARLALVPNGDIDRPNTKRILSVRDSKWRDLLDVWTMSLGGEDQSNVDGETTVTTEDALKWFMYTAGILGHATSQDEEVPFATTSRSGVKSINPIPASTIQTLPMASAHYPANIQKLNSLPAFVPIHPEGFPPKSSKTFISPALEELSSEATSQQASLKATLEAAMQEGDELKGKLDVALKRQTKTPNARGYEKSLDLWSGGPLAELDLESSLTRLPETHNSLKVLNVVPARGDKNSAERQQNLEDRVLALRNSLLPRIPSPSVPFEDVVPIEGPSDSPARQNQSKAILAEPAFKGSSSKPALLSSMKPVRTPRTPRPYQTSTPPTKSRSKSARKETRTLQRQEVDLSPFTKPKVDSLVRQDENQVDEFNSSADDDSRTPTRPRVSIPLTIMQTPYCSDEMIANMSLPDFSDGSLTPNATLSNGDRDVDKYWMSNEQEIGDNEEVPYEGHSVTLRDILVKAGDGGDIFRLIGDDVHLEGMGDETMNWG